MKIAAGAIDEYNKMTEEERDEYEKVFDEAIKEV